MKRPVELYWIAMVASLLGSGGCPSACEESEEHTPVLQDPETPVSADHDDGDDVRGDCVLSYSNGLVENPESYNYRTFLPERGGLYSVEVFGPVTWPSGSNRIEEDSRSERWGHILLSEPMPHPDAPHVRLSHLPVLPPVHRRYVKLTAEETRCDARARRDEVMSDPDATYRAWGDPPSVVLGELGLWDFDQDRPLTDAEIDAFPSAMREPVVSVSYRAVVNRSRRIRRLRELEAPSDVIDEEVRALERGVARLFTQIATLELDPATRDRALAACAR